LFYVYLNKCLIYPLVMSVDHPRDLDVIESSRGNAIQSITSSFLGLSMSDWVLLMAGIGVAAAVVLIA